MCVAPTRAEAKISRLGDPGPRRTSRRLRYAGAREPGTALVHEHWGDNVFLESAFEVDITPAFDAPSRWTREIRPRANAVAARGARRGRHFRSPLDQLTLYTGAQNSAHRSQRPVGLHGYGPGPVRIGSPDIGGGFATREFCCRKKVCLAWLATRKGYTVRWIEDRASF